MTLDDRIAPEASARARALADAWEARGVGPAVPAYASTLLHFDPLALPLPRAVRLARSLATRSVGAARPGPLVEIPVRYDGPDLADTARLSELTIDELVSLHSGREYAAHFVGFLPGFAYLGEVDERIVAPRLAEPRTRVPAGAVGVAGRQTGVYPFASPGGWRLVGRTDVVLFDASRTPPVLIPPGARVRFVPR